MQDAKDNQWYRKISARVFLEFYQSVKWIFVEIKSEKKLSYVATIGSDVKVRP